MLGGLVTTEPLLLLKVDVELINMFTLGACNLFGSLLSNLFLSCLSWLTLGLLGLGLNAGGLVCLGFLLLCSLLKLLELLLGELLITTLSSSNRLILSFLDISFALLGLSVVNLMGDSGHGLSFTIGNKDVLGKLTSNSELIANVEATTLILDNVTLLDVSN